MTGWLFRGVAIFEHGAVDGAKRRLPPRTHTPGSIQPSGPIMRMSILYSITTFQQEVLEHRSWTALNRGVTEATASRRDLSPTDRVKEAVPTASVRDRTPSSGGISTPTSLVFLRASLAIPQVVATVKGTIADLA